MQQPTLIEHYEITGRLAPPHGQADVYQARDTRTGEEVALKVLYLDASGVRFDREVEAMMRLDHPNIIRVIENGKTDGRRWIAMERLPQTLADLLRDQRTLLAPEVAVEIAIGIAEGLDYAGAHEIVHRDIKPSNILMTHDGVPKIADFGIARIRDWSSVGLTHGLLGSPSYMSPEQAKRETVGAASDMYSLGVVLFQILTGKLPFEGEEGELIKAHQSPKPPRVRDLRSDVWPSLEQVVARCLEKEPGRRFKTFADLIGALQNCDPVTTRVQQVTTRVQQWRPPVQRRTRMIAGAVGAAIIVVGLAALLWPSSTPAEVRQTLSASTNTIIDIKVSDGSTVGVTIPPSAAPAGATQVQVVDVQIQDLADVPIRGGERKLIGAFELNLSNDDDEVIEHPQFSQPVEVSTTITLSQLASAGGDFSRLQIAWLNDLGEPFWDPLPTTVNASSMTLSTKVSHFSLFGVTVQQVDLSVALGAMLAPTATPMPAPTAMAIPTTPPAPTPMLTPTATPTPAPTPAPTPLPTVVASSVPQPPTNVSADDDDAQAVVTWAAPVSNGGAPITAYTVMAAPLAERQRGRTAR
jgi:serine/threonine protein kinase